MCFTVAHRAHATRGRLIKKAARHETYATRAPPMRGPRIVVAAEAPAHMPNARPCSSPLKVAVMIERDPGTRIRRSLENSAEHEQLEVWSQAAQGGGCAESDQADRKQPAASVVVRQRTRKDQERAERQKIAVVDVGLAFEGAEKDRRQLLAYAGQGDGHDRGVEENDSRSEDDCCKGPALAGHGLQLSLGLWRARPARISPGMPAPRPGARMGPER
jgi:hypothetical protein